MLFDERELKVFSNDSERDLFRETIQSYYCKNYRSAIVSLFSLVMYDLYNKLNFMAEEGETKAVKKLKEVNDLIQDKAKYSQVENVITDFFVQNYTLHFDKFKHDLDYLKTLRDKCAHLQINTAELFEPKDYQVRMLISSMYDNLFTVTAPFIEDLFNYVQGQIERITSEFNSVEIYSNIYDKYKIQLQQNYFSRMSEQSIQKTISTFIRLLFISQEENSINNTTGLHIVFYCLLDYLSTKGTIGTFIFDDNIQSKISTISVDSLSIEERVKSLFVLISSHRAFCDAVIKNNKIIYDYLFEKYIYKDDNFEKTYCNISADEKLTKWDFYLENHEKFIIDNIQSRYDYLKNDIKFSDVEFVKYECSRVPGIDGFWRANSFMNFFSNNKDNLSDDAVLEIIQTYNDGNQFYGRREAQHEIKVMYEETIKRGIDSTIEWANYSRFRSITKK